MSARRFALILKGASSGLRLSSTLDALEVCRVDKRSDDWHLLPKTMLASSFRDCQVSGAATSRVQMENRRGRCHTLESRVGVTVKLKSDFTSLAAGTCTVRVAQTGSFYSMLTICTTVKHGSGFGWTEAFDPWTWPLNFGHVSVLSLIIAMIAFPTVLCCASRYRPGGQRVWSCLAAATRLVNSMTPYSHRWSSQLTALLTEWDQNDSLHVVSDS